jgi:hypothetical protein
MTANRSCVAAGVLAAALAFAGQYLTVRFNYGGNWTALFCTGARMAVPPELSAERIYTFPESTGYDGQFYHYVAHDPFIRGDLYRAMDAPEWRYRRILVPALAFLLAGGQARFVDTAYLLVVLFSVFLGAFWLSCYALRQGRSPWWGLGFLFVPAVVVSLDRMTVDVALAAAAAGFLLHGGSGAAAFALAAASVLTRETGILFATALVLAAAMRRQWLRSAAFALAPLPALAWYLHLRSAPLVESAPAYLKHAGAHWPGEAFLYALAHPAHYPFSPAVSWTLRLLDYAGFAGAVIGIVLALWIGIRRSAGPVEMAAALFAGVAIVLGAATGWLEPYGYSRTLSPLLLLLAARALASRTWWPALPLSLIAPRVLAQLGEQALGVLRGLLGTP